MVRVCFYICKFEYRVKEGLEPKYAQNYLKKL